MLGILIVALLSWGTWVTLSTMTTRADAQHLLWRLDHTGRAP
jgi:hypothetical protein